MPKGVFPHYDLFYALGSALIAEGIMSGCYHVCPSKDNFQFGKETYNLLLLNYYFKICLIYTWKNYTSENRYTVYK